MKLKKVNGWSREKPGRLIEYGGHTCNCLRLNVCSTTRHNKCVREKACSIEQPGCESDRCRMLGKKFGIGAGGPGSRSGLYKYWKRRGKEDKKIAKILKKELDLCREVMTVVYGSKK